MVALSTQLLALILTVFRLKIIIYVVVVCCNVLSDVAAPVYVAGIYFIHVSCTCTKKSTELCGVKDYLPTHTVPVGWISEYDIFIRDNWYRQEATK